MEVGEVGKGGASAAMENTQGLGCCFIPATASHITADMCESQYCPGYSIMPWISHTLSCETGKLHSLLHSKVFYMVLKCRAGAGKVAQLVKVFVAPA